MCRTWSTWCPRRSIREPTSCCRKSCSKARTSARPSTRTGSPGLARSTRTRALPRSRSSREDGGRSCRSRSSSTLAKRTTTRWRSWTTATCSACTASRTSRTGLGTRRSSTSTPATPASRPGRRGTARSASASAGISGSPSPPRDGVARRGDHPLPDCHRQRDRRSVRQRHVGHVAPRDGRPRGLQPRRARGREPRRRRRRAHVLRLIVHRRPPRSTARRGRPHERDDDHCRARPHRSTRRPARDGACSEIAARTSTARCSPRTGCAGPATEGTAEQGRPGVEQPVEVVALVEHRAPRGFQRQGVLLGRRRRLFAHWRYLSGPRVSNRWGRRRVRGRVEQLRRCNPAVVEPPALRHSHRLGVPMTQLAAVQRTFVVQWREPGKAARRVEAEQHHCQRPATGS